ncbi:hypothetical protein HN419_06645 [Candidatus Woesearchaeota archaeon]|jgi:glycerophosphoryl diester phosphodiesterase|nr:hypothetical protein [Candidatus Woesearchaeota archaeon]MBT3538174.1 hypothetical protein [Candidatus Woesearchaeota archaeon]MBT4697467.1 hypothetical protein [Candidatus Woesearchaeota archaeon]MBT4716889.1 hypothetical protein [Candidatus Woesearchaeota archaeon]MBT7105843.1 hypothetical protein [Candidatus Woesearchaeota archaeon]
MARKKVSIKTVRKLFFVIVLLLIALMFLVTFSVMIDKPEPNVDRSLIKNDPAVIAHRGAMDYAPESSLNSFKLAKEKGADILETDLHLTKDGKIVLFHDYDISRFSDSGRLVKDMTLDELREVRIGRNYTDYSDDRMIVLDELFDEFGKDTLYLLEVKNEDYASTGIEPVLVKMIKDRDLYENVFVSAFNPLVLMRLKRLDSNINVGLNLRADLAVYLRETWFKELANVCFLVPRLDMIDESFMNRYKNYFIFAWDIHTQEDYKRAKSLGVDGVVVDAPDRFTSN